MNTLSSCVLSNLDNPMLNGLTLGLSFAEDGQVQLQSDLFPCCLAQGIAWDESKASVRTCLLRARLHRVQKLFYLYRKTWPHAVRSPQQVPASYSSSILQELGGILKRDQPQGHISFNGQKHQPSLVWSKALAALWRFGVEARVLNLQKFDAQQLVYFTSDHAGPLALFIEQIDKLWDPMNVETLEHLVHRAYNANAFIWLEFIQEQYAEPDNSGDPSLKAEISRRLARKRGSQHPFELLSRDCRSRLQSLCGAALKIPSGAKHD